MLKLNIPKFLTLFLEYNVQEKLKWKTFPYLDLRSLCLSIVVEHQIWEGLS